MREHHNARYPFLFVQTTEEERIIRENRARFDEDVQFFSWDIAAGYQAMVRNGGGAWTWRPIEVPGFVPKGGNGRITDPGMALEAAGALPENSLVFLKDYHKYFEKITIIRAALNLKPILKLQAKTIVFLAAQKVIPPELSNDITVVDYPYPDDAALMRILEKMAEDNDMEVPENADTIVNAMRGLTWEGAENALALSLVMKGTFDVKTILDQKGSQLKASGVLEFGTYTETLDDLFGLEILKRYIRTTIGNPKARGVLMYGVPGTGKCLGVGTLVLKYDGSVCPVEKIRTGDALMGPDSKPRTVLSVTAGYGDLYEVVPMKGTPYVVNADHILSLKKSGINRIRNISVRDYLNGISYRWKGWRTEANWQTKDLPIPPYILGVYLGDGDSDRTAFTINDGDQMIVEEIAKFTKERGLILQNDPGHTGATRYRVVSKTGKGGRPINSFLNDLRTLRVFRNKHIPQIYKINDRKNRLELLAGLIDADGYKNGGYEIITKFDQMSEDILFLARSLGFAAYESEKVVVFNEKTLRYHRIWISGDCSQIPVLTPRRKCGQRKQIKDVLKTGIAVRPIGEGYYYGFELDGDHLFLLGDFTVTHNSHSAKATANEFGLPCFVLNFSEVKDRYVGASESKLREAFKTIHAVGKCVVFMDEIEAIATGISSGGDSGVGQTLYKQLLREMEDAKGQGIYWMATCNDLAPLIHESGGAIMRRFGGKFFCDMPTEPEARGIAGIWSEKEGVEIPNTFPLDGYTGADIASLAENIAMFQCDAQEASQYVLPYGKAHADELEEIRRKAAGVCIPAGVKQEKLTLIQGSRKVRRGK